MEKLIKSIESVHPGEYELRSNELSFIYDNYHNSLFQLIEITFKLGFLRGQKAVKNG